MFQRNIFLICIYPFELKSPLCEKRWTSSFPVGDDISVQVLVLHVMMKMMK